jgi:hypothetical protein
MRPHRSHRAAKRHDLVLKSASDDTSMAGGSASAIPSRGSVSGAPLLLALQVSGVQGGAGAVEGGGDEVAVDLMGDLDALVAEPARDLGDRNALGQGGGGVEVAQ